MAMATRVTKVRMEKRTITSSMSTLEMMSTARQNLVSSTRVY